MNTCPGPSGFNTQPTTRRSFLSQAGGGFGMVALASLLERQGLLAADSALRAPGSALPNPLAPRPSHLPAKAQRVIFLFMSGGPSHVDLFDPKPAAASLVWN